MRKFCSSIICFIICGLCFLCRAQNDYHFVHFTKSENNLSYNGVKTMIQDSRGFIWIGTYRGLSRYDGTRFRNFDRVDLHINSDSIISLSEDGSGNIWVGTEDGVVKYDYLKDEFCVLNDEASPDDRVYSLAKGEDGTMWVVTRKGLFSWDEETGRFDSYQPEHYVGMPMANTYRIAVGHDSKIYLATYCDDIYVFDKEERKIEPLIDNYFKGDDVEGLALSEDNRNILYVASKRHGLCSVNLFTKEIRTLIQIPSDRRPMAVGCSDHHVWFSTTDGLFRYSPSTGSAMHICSNPDDPFALSDNAVTCSIVDSSGGLWISTENGGVNYSGASIDRFSRIYRLDSGEILRGSYVKSLAQDSMGKVWVGTENLGLLLLNPNSGSISKYVGSGDFLPRDINALCADKDIMWIGSHGGIYRLDINTSKIKAYTNIFGPNPNSDNRVVSIFLSYDGDLFVGTTLGVSIYDRDRDCFVKIENMQGVVVESMAQDRSGSIWMATYSQGVYVYDFRNKQILHHFCQKGQNSVIPEMTSSMCIGSNGDVWVVGFSSGFFQYNGNDFETFNKSKLPALSTDVFYLALQDVQGRMWLSSDDGLVCYNPGNSKIKRFTKFDGLLNDRFKKAGLLLRDSRMVFGCDDGLILFDPVVAGSGNPALSSAISDFWINGERQSKWGNINYLDQIVLSPKDRNLSISFALPGISCGADGNILCRLDGYDQTWRDVTAKKTIDYYNVPKGSYTLRIATTLENGSLIDTHSPLKIVRRPSFFESYLGILVSVCFILLFAFMLFYIIYRNAIEKQKQKHKEAEEAMQEQLFHEKMSFFADVVHELKTPLTIIRTPLQHLLVSDRISSAQKEDVALICNNADYLNSLVKELLEFISVEEHGYVLEFHNIDVADRLGFICSNYYEVARSRKIKLTYTMSVEKCVCAVDSKALSKIVNNLLGNAIKYASSYIDVELNVDEKYLMIHFRNDGAPIQKDKRDKIFTPFVHYASGEFEDQSFGIGLPLARKLSELHGGSLILSDRGDCTEFILTLPVRIVDESVTEVENISEEGLCDNMGKPIILIVENNPDLLSYLMRKLALDYKMIGVTSAEKALEKLSKYKVDLLITDIGLQGMSGVELCSKVNNSPEYSYIPIIVLSAISTLQTKIQCMENGASMYIEKPFSLDYLMSCIDSVFEKRKSMKNAYLRSGEVSGKIQADLPNRDEDFIRRLDELVSANISDPNFSNKEIEKSLFVSHSSLNRKTKMLLGTTANDYIRTKRLVLAEQMLSHGGVRVNEVCFAVGFNSPSYFAKCFRAKYGDVPAEYIKKKNVSASDK